MGSIRTELVFLVVFTFFCLLIKSGHSLPCVPRSFGQDSILCVCNCTYCDTVEPIGAAEDGVMVTYTTSKAGKRMERSTINAGPPPGLLDLHPRLVLDSRTTYQEIFGFGSGFTDSSTRWVDRVKNICSEANPLSDILLKSYFSEVDGLGYKAARLAIGPNEASFSSYTYDDVPGDLELANFALNAADLDWKIPAIQKALLFAGETNKLKLIASPWSPPGWMKKCNCTSGGNITERTLIGSPGGPYYKTWANYFVKFLQAYKNSGIDIYALTPQNEPISSYAVTWPGQTYFPTNERDFIKLDLGPALDAAGFQDVKVFIYDDSRFATVSWVSTVVNDAAAAQYVDGVCVHWYFDAVIPVEQLDLLHTLYPQLPILNDEASAGFKYVTYPIIIDPLPTPSYGRWSTPAGTVDAIIRDLNHWVTGWIEHQSVGSVDHPYEAPILINATAGEFYKQPVYYIMGHFSAFLPPTSKRIKLNVIGLLPLKTQVTAFIRPDGKKVLIGSNNNDNDLTVHVSSATATSQSYQLAIPANSVVTALF